MFDVRRRLRNSTILQCTFHTIYGANITEGANSEERSPPSSQQQRHISAHLDVPREHQELRETKCYPTALF